MGTPVEAEGQCSDHVSIISLKASAVEPVIHLRDIKTRLSL